MLPAESLPAPVPDFGGAETMLPMETYHKATMAVSAPQFIIGAKLDPAPAGQAALRQRLVAQLVLRLLVGSSSPFYTRLYAEGLLNRDFEYDAEFLAGTGTVFFGGESPEPEKVLEALKEELDRVAREGFEPERFERAKRASLGARLRGLEDFGGVCISLASSCFDGYCGLDAIGLLGSVDKAEAEAFLREQLPVERLAIAILEPKKD